MNFGKLQRHILWWNTFEFLEGRTIIILSPSQEYQKENLLLVLSNDAVRFKLHRSFEFQTPLSKLVENYDF